MGEANFYVIGVLLIFVTFTIGIGVYFNKRTKSTSDYWVGGSSVGPWVTAISYVGTYYSTVALVGGPSYTFKYGLGYGIWQVAGTTWLFGMLPFLLMAVQIRKISGRLGAVTVPGWLSARFGYEKIRLYAAVVIALLVIPYGTAVIQATGILLSKVAGIPYLIGIILTAVTVTIYLGFSGYLGVAWNDTIQGWIMMAGALMIAPIALSKVGGINGLLNTLYTYDPKLLEIPGNLAPGKFVSLAFVWGFICWGQPQLITRFQGIKDSKSLGISMVIATVFTTVLATGFHFNGLLSRALYGDSLASLDQAIPQLAADMLPVWAGAIFVSAAVAASMSTLSSSGLVAGSAIAKDLYEDYYIVKKGIKIDGAKALKISKRVTTLAMLASFALAINPPGIVFQLAIFSQGTIAATLTGSLMYGIYWKRANWQGCMASMISGTVVTLAWYLFDGPWVHPYLPGMITSLLMFPIVTLLTPAPAKELVDKVFGKNSVKTKAV